MKNYLFIAVVFFISLTSCSSHDEISVNQKMSPSQVKELNNVYYQIDSINAVYASKATKTRKDKGYFGGWAREAIADHIGGIAGGWIGRSAGAALGGATGNPFGAIGGYLIGRKLGYLAGSAAASYAAYRIFNHYEKYDGRVNLPDSVSFLIDPSDTTSYGSMHNIILAKLLKNDGKYLNSEGTVDIDLLLDDCINYAKSYSPDQSESEIDSINSQREALKEQISIALEGIKDIKPQEASSVYSVYERAYKKLNKNHHMEKEIFDQQARMDYILGPTYNALDEENIPQFKLDIDKVITNSNLESTTKEKLLDSNSLIPSSILLWRKVNTSQQ